MAGLDECDQILEYFYTLEEAAVFRTPVAWKEWGLYDYPQIVKNPMDLGTIKKKMEKKQYEKVKDFVSDMRLVWTNCKKYNQDGSDLYVLANNLSNKFEEKIRTMEGSNVIDSSTADPTLDEKILFSQNVYKLSSDDLGKIVQILEVKCPIALEQSDKSEMEINIDAINGSTFKELDIFIQESLSKISDGSILSQENKKGRRKKDDGKKTKKQKTES